MEKEGEREQRNVKGSKKGEDGAAVVGVRERGTGINCGGKGAGGQKGRRWITEGGDDRTTKRGKERRVLSVRNVARAGACLVVTCCPSLA